MNKCKCKPRFLHPQIDKTHCPMCHEPLKEKIYYRCDDCGKATKHNYNNSNNIIRCWDCQKAKNDMDFMEQCDNCYGGM